MKVKFTIQEVDGEIPKTPPVLYKCTFEDCCEVVYPEDMMDHAKEHGRGRDYFVTVEWSALVVPEDTPQGRIVKVHGADINLKFE